MSIDAITAKMLDTAESLTPDDIITYLKSNGWVDAGPYGSLARLYRLQVDEHVYEAVIPNTQDTGDFKWRVIDVLRSLANAKGEEMEAVCDNVIEFKKHKDSSRHVISSDGMRHGSPETSSSQSRIGEGRADVALAIKSCLDSLMADATRCDLDDLAKFISLAALAAEEAALPTSSGASQFNELRDFLNQSSNFRKH